MDSGDPRVYFAAERTLLAWLRTAIAVMAFGFVVARFGLLLRTLRGQDATIPGPGVSAYLGACMVLIGVAASVAGAVQYRRYCRLIRPIDLPWQRAETVPVILAWTLVLTGLVLTALLLA